MQVASRCSVHTFLVATSHALLVQASAKAAREGESAAKQSEAAAQQDLEAAREVISSLTNQLAVTDQAAEQVGATRPSCRRETGDS